MIRLAIIIGAGSFLGGASRFLASRAIQNYSVSAFPLGTFIVNILGCFLLGLFYGMSEKGDFLSHEWRLFLTIGFCGGFTTFSAFAHENLLLLRNSDFFYFALYTSLSLFLGYLATFLGNYFTRLF